MPNLNYLFIKPNNTHITLFKHLEFNYCYFSNPAGLNVYRNMIRHRNIRLQPESNIVF